MADSRARHRALLAVLPRVFGGQPAPSPLAGIIEVMATALAGIDEGLIRTQRDHWLQLASGEAAGSGAASALERLGALLGIDRLDDEPSEAYRGRLLITARVLTRGLNTPRALLELAIATLGAEPCPRIEKHQDTTIGFGLPPGTIARCPACRTGKVESECPNAEARVLEAWITDNPPQPQSLVVSPQVRPGMRFVVENPSLDEDVPELRLKAIEQPTIYPCLHNRATGEIILYAGTLLPDEVLSVWPQVEPEETLRYASHQGSSAHHWREQYPSGSAVIIDRDGKPRTVSASIYYLNGARFAADDASPDDPGLARFASLEATQGPRFADPLRHGSVFEKATFGGDGGEELDATTGRFGSPGRQVRTPRVRPGADEWSYGVYTRDDVKAIAGTLSGPLFDNAPEHLGDAPVELTLAWWARRPASFRLSVPRSVWVGQAETRGAHRLLARWVQQVRAAGVVAAVDFPEPKKREQAMLGERASWHLRQQWRESLPIDEGTLSWMTQSKNREDHPLTDGLLTWRAVFDNTRLDASRFD